jgi:hypothetical protein
MTKSGTEPQCTQRSEPSFLSFFLFCLFFFWCWDRTQGLILVIDFVKVSTSGEAGTALVLSWLLQKQH